MAEYRFTLEPFSSAVLDAYRAFPTVLAQSDEKIGWPYAGPFQAGAPQTLTSSCNATSTWLAQSTNQPPPTQGQRGERGR